MYSMDVGSATFELQNGDHEPASLLPVLLTHGIVLYIHFSGTHRGHGIL